MYFFLHHICLTDLVVFQKTVFIPFLSSPAGNKLEELVHIYSLKFSSSSWLNALKTFFYEQENALVHS